MTTPGHLFASAYWGDTETVKDLIIKGASLHARNARGETALICAARGGRDSMVGMLLDMDVDVNAQDHQGVSALHRAVETRSLSMIYYLLANHINVDLRDKSGKTAFMWIAAGIGAAFDPTLFSIFDTLLKHGANVNDQDLQGVTALMAMSQYPSVTKSRNILGVLHNPPTNVSYVRELLVHGARVNAQDYGGNTALMHAALRGNADCVQLLLDHGANASLKNHRGRNALMITTQALLAETILYRKRWQPLFNLEGLPDVFRVLIPRTRLTADDVDMVTKTISWVNPSIDVASLGLMAHGEFQD